MFARRAALLAFELSLGILCGLSAVAEANAQPPFILTMPPDPVQLTIGSQIWTFLAVEVNAESSFSGAVHVAVTGVPTGIAVPQNPVDVVFAIGGATRQTAVFQFWASGSTAVGDAPIVFAATSDAVPGTATVDATLRVNSFSIAAAPASRTMPRKGSASFSFTVNPVNLFFGKGAALLDFQFPWE